MGGQRPAYSRPAGTPRPDQAPRPESGAPRDGASIAGCLDVKVRNGLTVSAARAARAWPRTRLRSQVADLVNLGKRLGVEQAELETQAGKPLSELNRREASQLLGNAAATDCGGAPVAVQRANANVRICLNQWTNSNFGIF